MEANSRVTRVAVQHPELREWDVLLRFFSPKEGFLGFPVEGPLDTILVESERMAPCVLLVDEDCLRRATSGEATGKMSFGSVRVLVLGSEDPCRVTRCLSIGCAGFVAHGAPPAMLRAAVRAVADGEIWAPRRALSHLVRSLLVQLGPQALTKREVEVLGLIAEGLKNRAIADRLCISHETVRWHIRSLYGKIGVHDRLGAVIYGRQFLQSRADQAGLHGSPRIGDSENEFHTRKD